METLIDRIRDQQDAARAEIDEPEPVAPTVPMSLAGIPFPRYVVEPSQADGFDVIDQDGRKWMAWDAGESEARQIAATLNAREWRQRREAQQRESLEQGAFLNCETDS